MAQQLRGNACSQTSFKLVLYAHSNATLDTLAHQHARLNQSRSGPVQIKYGCQRAKRVPADRRIARFTGRIGTRKHRYVLLICLAAECLQTSQLHRAVDVSRIV